MPFDDLEGYGRLGLLEARARFDPRHGVTFERFARYRVRGAVFDGLRQTGFLRRTEYAQLRAEAQAHDLLGEPVGDGPDGPSPAEDAKAVFGAITALATMYLTEGALLEEPPPDPCEAAEARADRANLRAQIRHLTDEEQVVLRAFYDLDDTGDSGAALARRMGLSRSQLARRHRRVLSRLRRLMGAEPDS
ncbi:MAG: sigma-70 family RNA polymerase sigma factor [Myxococcales bacterium]|nr:sigma-70 family RNA polymerase sigma factor [Myxococcales bacterium]MCB9522021.1 sigma-70 family RNA polymerase sigma factor [Myxococcales bacterium]